MQLHVFCLCVTVATCSFHQAFLSWLLHSLHLHLPEFLVVGLTVLIMLAGIYTCSNNNNAKINHALCLPCLTGDKTLL